MYALLYEGNLTAILGSMCYAHLLVGAVPLRPLDELPCLVLHLRAEAELPGAQRPEVFPLALRPIPLMSLRFFSFHSSMRPVQRRDVQWAHTLTRAPAPPAHTPPNRTRTREQPPSRRTPELPPLLWRFHAASLSKSLCLLTTPSLGCTREEREGNAGENAPLRERVSPPSLPVSLSLSLSLSLLRSPENYFYFE